MMQRGLIVLKLKEVHIWTIDALFFATQVAVVYMYQTDTGPVSISQTDVNIALTLFWAWVLFRLKVLCRISKS